MTVSKRLSTVQKNVETILKKYPSAKNSDKVLLLYYATEFCGTSDMFIVGFDKRWNPETIIRARRHLQSLGLYLSDKQVRKGREEAETEVHNFYR